MRRIALLAAAAVAAIILTGVVAAVMSGPEPAAAGGSSVHGQLVTVGGRQVPCVVAEMDTAPFSPEGGRAVALSCDWSPR